MKLKETLALPRTDFPMRAGLPQREPERLTQWETLGLYDRLREARAGGPKYVLHDGPPYANGHVHLGTALNKILKDFVLKARAQAGFDVPYVPGWDCHGMPIEHQVVRDLRKRKVDASPQEVRKHCRDFAERFLDVQRAEFKRLGVLGRWDDPYLTVDPAYEATIVEAFGKLYEKGYIYRGLRSIHWCATCQTALANAEVEYDENHESRTIHARFRVKPGDEASTRDVPDDAGVLIWTTTPWTIPANVAIAVHPEMEYVLVGGDAGGTILAKELLASVAEEVGWKDVPVEKTWKGSELVGLVTQHPLLDRESPLVPAEYVTADAGTGAVHTAPGHGADDFETARKEGLPIVVPVGKDGRYTEEAGRHVGERVFEANVAIIEDLREAGALVATGTVVHAYPTCWRCHQSLIFLATEQWFLNVEHENLRERCLDAVDKAGWVPAWGHDRMYGSVESRPDWCLSRQRAWGVPIPAFRCRACQEAVLTPAILEHVTALVREHGTDPWFELPASELLPTGTACGACGSSDLEVDGNILDVWFDAACSHLAVLDSGRWPELSWPGDLYLEAVDQHRGWFQVSLLNAMALRGEAPFRTVFTHGLILDTKLKKMSKSLGNVVAPEAILKSHGADVLRLFFASVDATGDVPFDKSVMTPVAESYRKIRNTLRFLLGNLAGFDPAAHSVPEGELREIDRHALHRLRELSAGVREAYDQLVFHKVHRLLLGYLTTDVSAIYGHLLKDRLYADAPESSARRSAQTVLFAIARELTQLLAPVLCFTADEAWEFLPDWEGKEESVHLATWAPLPPVDADLLSTWTRLMAVREEVLKALETAREAKAIGKSAEAAVTLGAKGELHALLTEKRDCLEELFVVSRVELASEGAGVPDGGQPSEALEGLWVAASPAGGTKCPRCWLQRDDGGALASHPDVCGRCAAAISEMGVELDEA
jgi:isoleucyl-tRNA synthetase